MSDAEKNECITVSVNGHYMADLLKQLSNFNKFAQVVIKIPTAPGRPILLEAKSKEGEISGRGLVMPMNR